MAYGAFYSSLCFFTDCSLLSPHTASVLRRIRSSRWVWRERWWLPWWRWWAWRPERGWSRWWSWCISQGSPFRILDLTCNIGGGVRGGGVQSRGRGGASRGGGGGRGARGGGRGGRGGGGGRGGARGGAKVILEPHRHPGIFIAKGKDHLLVTKNLVPGESVYGEKRITIEGAVEDTKVEYRVWNPFRSKLAAGVLGGMDDIFIAPGKKVLYLGAASGTSVSHVADIVGPVRIFVALSLVLLRVPLCSIGGCCIRGRVLASVRSRPD